MPRALAILFLLLVHHTATGQVMEGAVIDNYGQTPITGTRVINKRSGATTVSDGNGYYSIAAAAGDTLLFRHLGYDPVIEVAPYSPDSHREVVKYRTILMQHIAYNLKGATVTGLTKYQQDSAERHEEYYHELNKTLVPKPVYLGLGCAGCIGWVADKITGNSKESKEFRKQFAADDRNMFIDSRYNPTIVSHLTGLRDTDSIAHFIYRYPMAYDYARSATDLEIKIWIRDNYKQYMKMEVMKSE